MNADLKGSRGKSSDQNLQDLRKPKAQTNQQHESSKKQAEAAAGILKVGEDAKYSQGRTQAEETAAGRKLQDRRQLEEEKIVEANLAAYLKQQQLQAAAGHIAKTVKSLEVTLKDKLRIHENQPSHPSIWQVAKVLADIALKHAVKNLNNRQFEQAFSVMKLVQKNTEPRAGSNWSSNAEWVLLRKNLHKNFALYHQKNTMWQQAFDNLKLALRLEEQLGLTVEIINTSLTCAILQQKMKNYGLSIDYGQQCLRNIEGELGIKKGQALQEARYTGRDPEKQKFNDKHMTAYAIALHILGKNLLNLSFFKEAKHFITKAHYVVTKMLVQEKKYDLQLAIQMDMKTVLEKTRYIAEVVADPAQKGTQEGRGKRSQPKEQGLTEEDIERSLATIRSGLATVDEARDVAQGKYKEIEQAMKQIHDDDQIQEFREEFKELAENEHILARDEQLEHRLASVNDGLRAYAEPDEKEKSAVKKQALLKQGDKADKRETDPEYVQRLEEYSRGQEQLRLKQENFQKRQKEFEEKKTKRLASKQRRLDELEGSKKAFLEKQEENGNKKPSDKQAGAAEPKDDKAAEAAALRRNRLLRQQSEQRTKQAPINLAKLGAEQDTRGLVHVGAKGTRKFFQQRKRNILSLNRDQYQTENDAVKVSVEEYKDMLDRKNDVDKPGDDGESAAAVGTKGTGQLPAIASLTTKSEQVAKKATASSADAKEGNQRANLFHTGLKSTGMVVEKVKERVYKPPKPGSLKEGKRSAEDLKNIQDESRKALRELAEKDKEGQTVDVPVTEEPHGDKLSDGSTREQYEITEEGRALLAREDRNHLMRQKTYEQLKAEDIGSKETWGYDGEGNRVMLIGEDGEQLAPEDMAQELAPPEDEEAEDPMQGLAKLTKDIKAETEKAQKEKQNLFGNQGEKTEKAKEEAVLPNNLPTTGRSQVGKEKSKGILKSASEPGLGAQKKQISFAPTYDQRGVETGSPKGSRKAGSQAAGADRLTKARGRQASGQRGSQSQAGAGKKKKEASTEPSTLRGRREKREGAHLAKEGREKRDEKIANEKHDVASYYGVGKKLKVTAAKGDNPYQSVNADRLERLAQPRDPDKHKASYDMKAQRDRNDFEKEEKLARKLQTKKTIEFGDYIDRDVPHIKADGEFSSTVKTSKGLKEFQTRTDNKDGLFGQGTYLRKEDVDELKEGPSGPLSAQQMVKLRSASGGPEKLRHLRSHADHIPPYMRAARNAQLEKQGGAPDNRSRVKAFRKAMNDNVVQQMGLQNHIQFGQPQYLNLRDLRELEHRSAQQIQSLARGYFTRKWYLNYVVRKRLGVPFSGLEFAQNPFLRQFNKPNTYLNQLKQVDESNKMTVIASATDLKLSTIQIKRLRNRQQERTMRIKGNTKMPDNTDGSRLIAKNLQKGVTPEAIIANLQEDFLAQGLEAYDQFKRMDVGIFHDDQGVPLKKGMEKGKEIVEPVEDPRAQEGARPTYGVFAAPQWIGDRLRKDGGGRIVDTSESAAYIKRKAAAQRQRGAHKVEEGPTMANMYNQVATNEPADRKQPSGDDGEGPEGGSPARMGGNPGGASEPLSLKQAILNARDPDNEGAFFAPQRYQEFSREPIVFYKRVVNDDKMLRWTIKAGEAFKRKTKRELKFFMPITAIGQILGSQQLVIYKVNLELIKVSQNVARHLESFKFETIWPFILYLFNYWVKNQASLMMNCQVHPQRQAYQAEMRRLAAARSFVGYFHETPQFLEDLERGQQSDDPLRHAVAAPGKSGEPAQSSLKKKSSIFSDNNQKKQHDNFLDFSSEIEFDDRFDSQKYMQDTGAVDSLTEGQHRIDRSLPAHARPNTKVQRQKNRERLFEAYKKSIEDHELAQRQVTWATAIDKEQAAADPERAERERRREKELKEKIEAEKYVINIKDFINENYLYLPANQATAAYRLLQALQQGTYSEVEKKNGVTRKNMAFMNEERRRRLGLPSLTAIDYNCIERAATKLKLIVDSLMLSRRMSSYAVVPKDVALTQMMKQQQKRHERHQMNAAKLNKISRLIYQQWGVHVEMEPEFNPESAQVQQSIQKIKQYQLSNHMTEQAEEGLAQNIAIAPSSPAHQQIGDEQLRVGDAAAEMADATGVKTLVFDQDMAELEAHYGTGKSSALQRNIYDYDAFAARHQRIVNEFENYIEDRYIVDQQTVRLAEEETGGSTPIFLQTIYVRKIKSNIENIVQILWEREAEKRKEQGRQKKLISGNREADQQMLESDEDPNAEIQGATPPDYGVDHNIVRGETNIRLVNEAKRKELLEKAPKIVRLQSKVCRIMSDHEDVAEFDAQEYPPGTNKISKFMALDVEQEKLEKQHTAYKTYAQVQICSAVNRRQMWDDSVNLPWETFVEFFKTFGIIWNPISFLKRGHFQQEEAFLVNEYMSRCFYLDQDNMQSLALDLRRLNFHQIKFDEIFLRRPEHQPEPSAALEKPQKNNRLLFEKYITNGEFITRFEDAEYDKLIFPFYDESGQTFRKLFKFGRQKEFKEWIDKFMDPEEQKESSKLNLHMEIGGMGTTTPILMVEASTLAFIRQDPQHMFNLTLSNFNNRQDDLLYLGRLQLASPMGFSKIEPIRSTGSSSFNLKIEYFVRGMIPTLLIKAFDSYTMEVLQFSTVNQKHIKMIIRICNQQSDKMIQNQLQSLISIRSSKLTVGRSLFLNFNRRQLYNKNLDQSFVNMMLCNELLLQRFVNNNDAAKNQLMNNGIRQFKGVLRNLQNLQDGHEGVRSWLVNVNQYDMHVETLLYYNPMTMVHGNKHINASKIKAEVILPLLQENEQTKSFDKVKVWKINLLDMNSGYSDDILLSLHDLDTFYESDLPNCFNLDNLVELPNLLDLLSDYLNMITSYRSIIGRIMLWKVPQYKRRVDKKTGRMMPINTDELYRMKILDIYKQMLKNIQQQQAFEDGNALPLSLDSNKQHPDRSKQQPPNLCLRCKTIREKNMPIFENNSKQVLKLQSQDTQVIMQRPKVFHNSFKKLQYVLITVILHPSMECWIWQLYFPKNQRTFSCTIYSSDLFSLDDEILNDDYIMNAEDPSTALWAHLINLCRLVRNPIGDIMIQIQNFKEPLREILFQDVVYNQNAKDMMFMEVVLKNYSNLVTDVEGSSPSIDLKSDDIEKHTFAVRAFSLTRNVWIKDYQPFFEVIAMLKREKYYVEGLEYFYYTMLRDTAVLLSNKIIFSDAAKTQEVKKRRLVYDIKSIIGRKQIFERVSDSIKKSGSPKKEANIDELLDSANRAVLQQEAHEQTELTKMNKISNRQDWENVVLLNRIIFQAIISHNPVQLCTVIYNEVKDVFIYRLYRNQDSSTFERQISSSDVARTCAPHLRSMLEQGLHKDIGERVAQHYMANVLVASVLDFYKIR